MIKSPPSVLRGMCSPCWDQYDTSTSSACGWGMVEDVQFAGGRLQTAGTAGGARGSVPGPRGALPVLGQPCHRRAPLRQCPLCL